jgi:hypothetical protein
MIILLVTAAVVLLLLGRTTLFFQPGVEVHVWPYELIFSNSDLSPCTVGCLLGISPGMNYIESIKLLLQHPLMHNPRISSPISSVTSLEDDSGLVVTLATAPAMTVVYVQLEWSKNREAENAYPVPRLGDMLLEWGTPDSVGVKQVGCFGFTSLGYGDFQVVTDFAASLRPTTPVRSIYLRAVPAYNAIERREWSGFSYTWRYGATAAC